MDFIEYTNNWVKSEVAQGWVMVGAGIVLSFILYIIIKNENQLFVGSVIPLVLLFCVFIGYGAYILYSRPAHAQESIALYKETPQEAIAKEKSKHINDNNAGKTLLKYVYPILMAISALALFFVSSPYYKGLALGFVILFLSFYIIDSGFVSRSDDFLLFLDKLD